MKSQTKQLVRIFSGTVVYCLDTQKTFISQKDITAELNQYRLGFCYYNIGDRIFRVNQYRTEEVND